MPRKRKFERSRDPVGVAPDDGSGWEGSLAQKAQVERMKINEERFFASHERGKFRGQGVHSKRRMDR